MISKIAYGQMNKNLLIALLTVIFALHPCANIDAQGRERSGREIIQAMREEILQRKAAGYDVAEAENLVAEVMRAAQDGNRQKAQRLLRRAVIALKSAKPVDTDVFSREGHTGFAGFPELSLDFFDARAVHRDARGFQLAFYERNKRRALFIPWGPGDQPLGVLLAYHTVRDFREATSYQAVDLTKLIHPDAQGFGGAFTDDEGHWLYFPAFRKQVGNKVVANTLTIRFNLLKELDDPTAYELFDITQLRLPRTGWVHGGYVNGFAYFTPTLHEGRIRAQHGILLRYDASRRFTDPMAWSTFDLARRVHGQAKGFQSAEVKPPFVYLIPYGVGASHIVRYDTRKLFSDRLAYEVFDLTNIYPDAKGFTGSMVVGNILVLTPWRDLSKKRRQQSMGIAVAFDTRRPLANRRAWSFIDLTQVHPHAQGYTDGWVDKEGFVYFVPTANFAIGKPPPFVIWDSKRPFAQASSWTSWPSTSVSPSTGAAYDGENRAWLAPYGIRGDSGLIAQVMTGRG